MPHPSVGLQLGGAVGRVAFLLAFCALALTAIAIQFAKVRALYGGDGAADELVNCRPAGRAPPSTRVPASTAGSRWTVGQRGDRRRPRANAVSERAKDRL